MPILAIDSMGNLYETDPNFPDGSGRKGRVPNSKTGDTAIDGAYSRSAQNVVQGWGALSRFNAKSDREAAHLSALEAKQKIALKRELEKRREIASSKPNRDAMILKGLKADRMNNGNVGLSGSGLSSNGLPGEKNQRTRQQRAAEQFLSRRNFSGPSQMTLGSERIGFFESLLNLFKGKKAVKAAIPASGEDLTYGTSKAEREQYRLNQQYAALKERQAREEAARNMMTSKGAEAEWGGAQMVLNKGLFTMQKRSLPLKSLAARIRS